MRQSMLQRATRCGGLGRSAANGDLIGRVQGIEMGDVPVPWLCLFEGARPFQEAPILTDAYRVGQILPCLRYTRNELVVDPQN